MTTKTNKILLCACIIRINMHKNAKLLNIYRCKSSFYDNSDNKWHLISTLWFKTSDIWLKISPFILKTAKNLTRNFISRWNWTNSPKFINWWGLRLDRYKMRWEKYVFNWRMDLKVTAKLTKRISKKKQKHK